MKKVIAAHYPERTQRARHDISVPVRWIVDHYDFGYDVDVLHFGEGKAFEDTRALRLVASTVVPYDPYSPNHETRSRGALRHHYNYGVCSYVLNVLPSLERHWALETMLMSCETGIVAVRTDVTPQSWHRGMDDGVLTRKDTFQSTLDHQGWLDWFWRNGFEGPWVLHRDSAFSVFELAGDLR